MDVLGVTEGARNTVWWTSVIVGVQVIVVVAWLLHMIARTARQIDDSVSRIWTVGQSIANNTVHIPLLQQTNRAMEGILHAASGVDRAAGVIEAHATECPGCPKCVLGSPRKS